MVTLADEIFEPATQHHRHVRSWMLAIVDHDGHPKLYCTVWGERMLATKASHYLRVAIEADAALAISPRI